MPRNAYVFMRCSRTAAPLVARFTFANRMWLLVETRPTSEPTSSSRLPAATLDEGFGIDDIYQGCIDCGNRSYVKCSCSALACWCGEGQFLCPTCGQRGDVEGLILSIAVDDLG